MPQSTIKVYLERIPQLRSRRILEYVEAISVAMADNKVKKKMYKQLVDAAGFQKEREVPSPEALAFIGIAVEMIP